MKTLASLVLTSLILSACSTSTSSIRSTKSAKKSADQPILRDYHHLIVNGLGR